MPSTRVIYNAKYSICYKRPSQNGSTSILHGPAGCSPIVVQHVRVGDKRARSEATNVQAEVAAANAHARPLELLERGHLAERRVQVANDSVVALDRQIPLVHLHFG